MGLDIRIPLGLLFLLIGALLAGYGLATLGSPIYARSLGIDLNLVWGAVLLVLGAILWLLGRRGQRAPQGEGTPASTSRRAGH